MAINIVVQDKVDSSIEQKLLAIAKAAGAAEVAVKNAQKALGGGTEARAMAATSRSTNAAALAASRYATAQAKAAAAIARTNVGLNGQNTVLRSNGLRWAKVTAALAGLTLTAHHVVAMADSYTVLQNKLSVVADDMQHVNRLTAELGGVALRARAPIQEVAKSFTRFDLALAPLGASQAEVLRITETVSKALTLSGATAGEQASGLLQLSQAFNKGKLDGDEFRSMMENAPVVMTAVAKSMGVARGELLKLAPQGKITAQVLYQALSEAAVGIDAAFAKTVPTIEQAFTQLRTKATLYFGELGKQTGAMAALSGAIMVLANNLDTLAFIAMAALPFIAAFAAPRLLSALGSVAGFVRNTTVAFVATQGPVARLAAGMTAFGNVAARSLAVTGIMLTTSVGRMAALSVATATATGLMAALGRVAARTAALVAAAFSFTGVLVMLGTLAAAAVAFGDKLVLSANSGFTLRDKTIAVFGELSGFIGYVGTNIANEIAGAMGLSENSFTNFGEVAVAALRFLAIAAAVTVDSVLTLFRNVGPSVKFVFSSIGTFVANVFRGAYNSIATSMNDTLSEINKVIDAINKARELVGNPLIPRLEVKVLPLKKTEMPKFSLNTSTDAVGALDAFNARTDAKAKAAAEARRQGELREAKAAAAAAKAAAAAGGNGAAAAGGNGADQDATKAATDHLAEFIAKNQQATAAAKRLNDENERFNELTELNKKLTDDGKAPIDLDSDQGKYLASLVATRVEEERLGAARQEVYASVNGPIQAYNDALKTTAKLEADNIPKEKIEEHLATLKDGYDKATMSVAEYNKKVAVKAAVEAGKSSSGKGRLEGLDVRATAAKDLFEGKDITAYEYQRALVAINAETARLQLETGNATGAFAPLKTAMLEIAAATPSLAEGIADVLRTTITSAVDGVANASADLLLNFSSLKSSMEETLGRSVSNAEVLKETFKDLGRTIIKEVVTGLIKVGVQHLLNSVIQKTTTTSSTATGLAALAASTKASVAAAAVVAAAWAPAAAAVSAATFGANTVPAFSGMALLLAGVVGLLAGVAVSKFADGGYVSGAGTGRSDSIPARLSHGEFVMNAKATSENYGLLHAMNTGKSVGGGGGMRVTVVNQAGGVTHDVQQIGPDEVRIIARQEAQQTVRKEAGRVVAHEISNPNSATSKALNRNTNVGRRR
jgi:tape measure domain-containing protein